MSEPRKNWDSTLAQHLHQLPIRYDRVIDISIGRVVSSLGKYGFALLQCRQQHPEDKNNSQWLVALSEKLGTVVPQSPRNELIEDVRDFSDVDEKMNVAIVPGESFHPILIPRLLLLSTVSNPR